MSTSPINGNIDNTEYDKEEPNSRFNEQGEPSSFSPRDDIGSSSESHQDVEENGKSNDREEDAGLDLCAKEDDGGKSVRFSLMDVVKSGETFQNKSMLKTSLEMSAIRAERVYCRAVRHELQFPARYELHFPARYELQFPARYELQCWRLT